MTITATPIPTVVPSGEGAHLHFLNHLATTKVTHDTTASGINVTEFNAPRGFGPPLHVHYEEDEVVLVLDGEIRFCAGDLDTVVTADSIVVLPRSVPHTFQVLSESARFLAISVGGDAAPASFDRFVATVGTPLADATVPEPVEIDPGKVGAAGAANGMEILGPPLGVLA
jgi:quercetin dioxygenase-like cupin family protein